MADKEGAELLASLRKGEDKLTWGQAKRISRLEARTLPPQLAQAIFRMETSKLPSYAGSELPGGGYALLKLNRIEAGAKLDDTNQKNMQQQLSRLLAQEEFQDYLQALRSRYKVEVNHAALELKEQR